MKLTSVAVFLLATALATSSADQATLPLPMSR